jgi:DNA-binding LytR/AlgR family response regulator
MQTFVCTHRTPGWTVALHVERGRTADEVEGYLRTLGAVVKQATVSSTLTPVPGLGDRAWWGPVNPTNGILHVVKGTDIVWLQTHGKGIGAGTLDKTKLLMQATLSRYAPGP